MTTIALDSRRVLTVPTLGVEEELFLLRPDGSPASVAPEMLAQLAPSPRFHHEWMQFQLESVTGVCTDLASLSAELVAGRRSVALAAAEHGAVVVSSGTPPFGVPGLGALTDDGRFHRLLSGFPDAARDVVACGTHVHVGVPTRALGVAALNRVRGWLPVLMALSGNSPFWNGRDTGWESYRHERFAHWPTARVPPWCADASAYDAEVALRISAGEALDEASVYWFARLSPGFPTLEFRIADAGLTVRDTLLQAALCRALVATALAEIHVGMAPEPIPEALLNQSVENAARHGLGALLVDPDTGGLAPGYTVLYGLVAHVHAALAAAGDLPVVLDLVAERRALKSGATRQRALMDRLGGRDFVAALAATTFADPGFVTRDPAGPGADR